MDEPTSSGTAAGTAALIIGILALALAIVPFLGYYGVIPGIAALVLGIVGKRRAREAGRPKFARATAGVVLGVLSIVLGLAQTISVPAYGLVATASWIST